MAIPPVAPSVGAVSTTHPAPVVTPATEHSVLPASRIAPPGEVAASYLNPDDRQLQQALQQLNDKLDTWATNLRFELDEETSRVIVQVVDGETGEVIRQIPAEEVVHMSKMLGKLQDLAFHSQA